MKENPVVYASHNQACSLGAKCSNKAIAAAIFLDMHTSATPLSFVSFRFELQFTKFQKDVSNLSTQKRKMKHATQTLFRYKRA
jgi:hypothetical protein